MPTSNTEELGRFLKCTVIGRGVFGPCTCCGPNSGDFVHKTRHREVFPQSENNISDDGRGSDRRAKVTFRKYFCNL